MNSEPRGVRSHHGVPRRRQRHRARGRAGAARHEPDLEVVGTAGDYDELDRRRRGGRARRCSSPTSGCRRASSARASTRPRSCASATRAPAWSSSRSTTTPSTRSRCSPRAPPGYAYLLKDRIAEGNQLAQRRARGRDRRIGARPEDRRGARAARHGERRAHRRRGASCCSRSRRAGRSRRSRRAQHTTPAAIASAVEQLFLKLVAGGERRRRRRRCERLRMLHQAIVDREEQGETLSRLLPRRTGREAAPRGPPHRRDRGARRHRAHVRHPRLLGDRRDDRPGACSRISSTSTAPR